MSIYQNFLALERQNSNERADEIENFLSEMENINDHIQCVILSLRSEENLPQECMKIILDFMLSEISLDSPPGIILDKYRSICREHELKGEAIEKSDIQYFGNVIYKQTFIDAVIRANTPSVKRDKFQKKLEKYIENGYKGIRASNTMKEFEECYISSRKMWATWEVNSKPFEFMKTRNLDSIPPMKGSLCEVRLSLALYFDSLIPANTLTPENNSMLLLTYDATGVEAYIPTIADAGGYKYFSPCPQGSKHGLTNPNHQDLINFYIDSCLRLLHYDDDSYNTQPRPEAVHKPITIGCIKIIEDLPVPGVLQV